MRTSAHRCLATYALALVFWLTGLAIPAAAEANMTKAVASRSLPAVVTIATYDAQGQPIAQGSGFIVRTTGLIVTNFHVIKDAAGATVHLQNGDTYPVEGVLEADPAKDFAVLKIKAVSLPVVPMGDSERLEPGESVIALGAPLGLSGSVTQGTFSQLRPFEGFRMLQHSAAISHGSSGGPLMLENGDVVGINTLSRTDGNALYFALPINYVRAAIEESDGRLIQLSVLSQAVAAATAKAEREEAAQAYAQYFYTYKDPQALFAVDLPRAWQVERTTWTDPDGTYHVVLMSYSAGAQFASMTGWMSEGLRMHLSFAPRGQVWRQAASINWATSLDRSAAAGYAQYKLEEAKVVEINGTRGRRAYLRGTTATLREIEHGVFYRLFDDKATVSIEMALPESKVKALPVVVAAVEASLDFGWTR